ncbi:MAG: polysaccharide deacetylase family protein [Anaerolineae bacterium]
MVRFRRWLRKAFVYLLACLLATPGMTACRPSTPNTALATSSAILAASPTVKVAVSPTLYPTITPSPEPTRTPTPSPSSTPSATATPTTTPTPAPTPTPLPQPTPDGIARTLRVPILMYHYISTPPEDANSVRRDLSLPPELFEAQLKYLVAQGYQSITLSDLVMALQTGSTLPPKPVIITLDDGYRDAYTNAYPLLRKYGMKATIFVITGMIDDNNPNYVTWAQVAEMSGHDIDIESHSVNHPDLRNRNTAFLQHELVASKQAIEARTGRTVRFICYPSGHYDANVIRLLPGAGYWAAVTTMQGIEVKSSNLYELVRLRIRGYFGAEQLEAIINYF